MKTHHLSKPKTVNFHTRAEADSEVYVTGSFNHWNGKAKKMIARKNTTDFYITLMVPPGRHEYKFVVNGQYKADPECRDWVLNEFGTLNSVIQVE